MPKTTIASFTVEHLQIMNEHGEVDHELEPHIDKDQLVQMYKDMVLTRKFDDKLFSLQRQGRTGTVVQVKGQEACQVPAMACLREDDWVVPAFRETAALIARGVPLEAFILYAAGDERGSMVKGHELPTSIPVGSQPLHATGIAWGMKLKGTDSVAITYFGDGATSEGDFHEALNFAAVQQAPVIFMCQNNQFAISTPTKAQTNAQTFAQKAIAYNIPGIRVDGNDTFAVYSAVKTAVERARAGGGPTLIECFTYRLADHTSSDDAKRYRSQSEVEEWEQKDPIARLNKYLTSQGLWNDEAEVNLVHDCMEKIEAAVKKAEEISPPELEDMFKFMYKEMDPTLQEQLEGRKRFKRL